MIAAIKEIELKRKRLQMLAEMTEEQHERRMKLLQDCKGVSYNLHMLILFAKNF